MTRGGGGRSGTGREAPGPVGGRAACPHPTPPSEASASCGHFWPLQAPLVGSHGSLALGEGQSAPLTLLPPQRMEKGWARSQGTPSPNTRLGLYRAAVITCFPGATGEHEWLPRQGPRNPWAGWRDGVGAGWDLWYCTPRAAWQPPPKEALPKGRHLQSREPNGGEGQDRKAKTQPLSAQQVSGDCGRLSPHHCISREHAHTREGRHQGTPRHGARDARRARSQAQWGGGLWEVGSGLLGPPRPHLTTSQGTGMMGESCSTSPTILQPAEHRACPCMAPAVSKQPGPGPRGPCRHQLGPAEGPW